MAQNWWNWRNEWNFIWCVFRHRPCNSRNITKYIDSSRTIEIIAKPIRFFFGFVESKTVESLTSIYGFVTNSFAINRNLNTESICSLDKIIYMRFCLCMRCYCNGLHIDVWNGDSNNARLKCTYLNVSNDFSWPVCQNQIGL